jgi:DNA-binding transcriptional LysR family regulator
MDLAGHDCISYPGYFGPDVWTFGRGKAEIAVPVDSRLVVSSLDAVCEAARAGIGLAVVFTQRKGGP